MVPGRRPDWGIGAPGSWFWAGSPGRTPRSCESPACRSWMGRSGDMMSAALSEIPKSEVRATTHCPCVPPTPTVGFYTSRTWRQRRVEACGNYVRAFGLDSVSEGHTGDGRPRSPLAALGTSRRSDQARPPLLLCPGVGPLPKQRGCVTGQLGCRRVHDTTIGWAMSGVGSEHRPKTRRPWERPGFHERSGLHPAIPKPR